MSESSRSEDGVRRANGAPAADGPPAADAGASSEAASLAWALAPGTLLAGVAGGIAFPILPAVGLRAGLSLAFIGAILAANRGARIVSNPIVGLLSDRLGGRRTLLAGLVIQVAVMGLYVLGVTTSHPGFFFLVGRLLHGPGSSCVFVSAQALVLTAARGRRSGRAAGVVRASIAIGVPTGLMLGGFLADKFGEAVTFEGAAVAIVLAGLLVFARVPDLRAESKQRFGLFDSLRALADKRLAAIGGLNFAMMFAASGMVLTTSTLLVHVRGFSVFSLPERATASVLMGWLVISDALSTPLFGRLGDRLDAHAQIGLLGIASMIPAMLVIANSHTAGVYALGLGLLGVSTGALGPSVLALLGELVPPAMRGLAVGALQVCADLGGMLGPLIGTALFAGPLDIPYYVSAAVLAAFLPGAIYLVRAHKLAAARAPAAASIDAP